MAGAHRRLNWSVDSVLTAMWRLFGETCSPSTTPYAARIPFAAARPPGAAPVTESRGQHLGAAMSVLSPE